MSTLTKEPTRIRIKKRVFLPAYHHLLNSDADIDFYWGGRDSGKSRDIAQQLVRDCLMLPYFRCLLIKKTFNTIKDSQWQTIKDVVEKWKLTEFFTFRVAPLTIECNNGNRFLARGCDDPQSIKSTNEPSHSWIEEANQLTFDDFITVTTTLRAGKNKIKQRISFNPECEEDYEEFWLYKIFFSGKDLTGEYKWVLEMDGKVEQFKYTSTHTTYHDNPYCSVQRKMFLEMLKETHPYYYQVYTLGLWGRRKNSDPFFYTFDRSKHLGKTTLSRSHEVIISMDFNISPMTAGIYQIYNNTLFGIEAINLNHSNIYDMCDYIMAKYSGCLFLVTGDASGRNSSALVRGDVHFYTVVKEKLNLSNNQLKVPSVNPSIEENRMLCNSVLHTYKCIFDPENCKALIYDFLNVSVTELGKIDKGDRSNPKKRADHADHFRYMCGQFLKHTLKN